MAKLEQFKLHPSVIYSIIREQAGSPEKALAELVMNSIDAGAQNIHLDLTAEKFCIKDDGLGFKSLDEIEMFFGKFGTPHQKNDSAYGQFRLGRGQCFSLSKTEWRSGQFGMSVDLACVGKTETHGYQLHEFADHVQGCVISGEFYESLHIFDRTQSPFVFDRMIQEQLDRFLNKPSFSIFEGDSFFERLMANLCLLKGVNFYFNGHLVNGLLESNKHHILETDTANYYLNKSSKGGIILLNKGIYIGSLPFALPLIIDFKESPNLNIARNQINAECPIYIRGRNELYGAIFSGYINGEKWANAVGNMIASNLLFCYIQFEKEFVHSYLSTEQRIAFAKKYQIFAIDAESVKGISLWDGIELARSENVYLNDFRQNSGVRRNQLQAISQNMNAADAADRKLLMDINGCLVFSQEEHGRDYVMKLPNWIGASNPSEYLFEHHSFFQRSYDLESNALARISVKKTTSVPKNKSLEVFEKITATRLNVEVSKAWVSKNDLARQTFEDKLYEYQQGLTELVVECSGQLPDNILLSTKQKVVPFFVGKLDSSVVNHRIYYLDETAYLIVTEEAFAQGAWMSSYMKHLFGAIDSDEDLTYKNADFNENFHDNLDRSALTQIFDGLSQVALLSSAVLIKKPMRASRKAPIEVMKSAWSEIVKGIDGIQDNEDFAKTLNTFNQINTK